MKEKDRTELLKKILLLNTLSSAEIRQIQDKFMIKRFKKNESILHEEDTNAYMYFILDGEAKVVNRTEKGKEILLTMHQTGDFFGELSVIDGKTTPAAVIATKDSDTALISKNDFYTLLYSQHKILENLLQLLCSRIRESIRKVQILNFNNAAQRVKMLFLMLSESYGKKTDQGTVLAIRLSHQDIADTIGLTRETVTRVLDKWKKSGEIDVLKSKFILLRPEFESITF